MDDRYAKSMERAERVLQNLATRTPEARAAMQRTRRRRNSQAGKRALRIAAAVAAIFAAMIAWGVIVGPVGTAGLMLAVVLAVLAASLLIVFPKDYRQAAAVEQLSNAEVVHRLDTLLIRERPALPAPALSAIDAISAQLPLLEQRLETLDPLDPLAQDARRLMGQHLPDLIARYEKVPATHRKHRDGDGMSVEDRLLSGLGAAKGAMDEIGNRLVQNDLSAFETQGRFIESRYKDGELG